MRASFYAQALYELLESRKDDREKLVGQFTETVVLNGHRHLFPKIIKAFERIEARRVKESTIEVTSAHPLSDDDVSSILKKEPFKHALSSKHRKVVRKIDSTIVGGIVVCTGTLRVDASYKRMLLDLYQKMTVNL